MTNKFLSVLETIGRDFKKGLDACLKIAPIAQAFVTAANPVAGAILAATIGAVALAEQKAAARGQTGTGVQKMAEVTAIVGPLLTTALGDAGKPAAAEKVTDYINNVVGILKATPATDPALPPASTVAAAAAPAK